MVYFQEVQERIKKEYSHSTLQNSLIQHVGFRLGEDLNRVTILLRMQIEKGKIKDSRQKLLQRIERNSTASDS